MALQDVCRQYGISFKKRLGQNLLLDENINRIMVDAAALTSDDDVIEVGAGLGALTKRLCKDAGRVLAVEIDRAFMPCLEDQFAFEDKVILFRGDILNHTPSKLINEYLPNSKGCKVVANLPYYITTPILFHFWESPVHFSRIVVMIQEEVGLRMVAPVSASNYGVLSLIPHLYGKVDIVHRVPRTCFRPIPKVDSCIVRIRCHEKPPYEDLDIPFVSKLIRASFSQRRKTMRNSLTKSGNFGAPKDTVLEAMEAAKIDPGRRPQTMSLDEFVLLAHEIRGRLPKDGDSKQS